MKNKFRGMKRGSFLQKSTLYLIMKCRKLDTVERNCIIFYTVSSYKYAIGLLLYGPTFSNPSRQHSQAVHLRKE